MMKSKKRVSLIGVFLSIVMLLCCGVIACSGAQSPTRIAVESVELNTATMTLGIGETKMLSSTVLPMEITDAQEVWTSDDKSIATVNAVGKVTGVAVGKTNINVTVGGKTASCIVTVIDKSQLKVRVKGVSLDKKRATLEMDETVQLTATVSPENASNKNVSYSATPEGIVTVTDAGLVTAVAPGKATVTVTTEDLGFSASCIVTVNGTVTTEKPLYVEKVSSLENRDNFIMGMDASAVLAVENARRASGAPLFKNFDGTEEDVFKIMKDNGVTDIRIRVWNDPADADGNSYGGGNCDVANAVAIAARCQAVGLGVIVDFHYSDFWADPGKQKLPKAWSLFTQEQIEQAIYDFTVDSLTEIKKTDVKITAVQVGNETTSSFCGSKDWSVICKYFSSGAKGVRDVTGSVADGGAKVAIHFTNPGSADYLGNAKLLNDAKVDYDIFGSSYYSYYASHGSLDNLAKKLKAVHDTYGKEVMVLETAYSWTQDDMDGLGNHSFDTSDNTPQPRTEQGLANAVVNVIKTIANLGEYGLGVCYWEGTWLAASASDNGATNRNLCVEYGCGWATEYANGYDGDANNGGTQVDCDAFWRSDTGMPLQALQLFKLAKTGQVVDLSPDFIPEVQQFYTVNQGPIELPSTLSDIVLNTGSMVTDAISWDVTEEELDQLIQQVGVHIIRGITQNYGGDCSIQVRVTNVNLLDNGSFEDCTAYGSKDNFIQGESEMGGWKRTYNKATNSLQLYVSNDKGNAVTGGASFHFWDEGIVDFKLFRTVDISKLADFGNGKYTASFDIQGGNGTDFDIYAYITLTYKNGTSKTEKGNVVQLTKWRDWHSTMVSVDIDDTVESVTVGINVTAGVDNTGPWGNIDNCQFYFDGE